MHSTRERLSTYWQRIKEFLLSPIEEWVGPLTNKQQQLITVLEVVSIENFITPRGFVAYSYKLLATMYIELLNFAKQNVPIRIS